MEKKVYLCSGCLSGSEKNVGFSSDMPVEAGDVVSVEMEDGRVLLATVNSIAEANEGSEIHQWSHSFSCFCDRKVQKVYKAAP